MFGLPVRLIATLCGESEVWVNANQKMKEMMGSFNRDTVANACKSLRSSSLFRYRSETTETNCFETIEKNEKNRKKPEKSKIFCKI